MLVPHMIKVNKVKQVSWHGSKSICQVNTGRINLPLCKLTCLTFPPWPIDLFDFSDVACSEIIYVANCNNYSLKINTLGQSSANVRRVDREATYKSYDPRPWNIVSETLVNPDIAINLVVRDENHSISSINIE